MSDIKIKTIKLKTLLSHFKENKREDRKYCFIIGSGASKQSGIKTGGELVEQWIKKLDRDYGEDEVIAWMADANIQSDNLAPHYSTIYSKRFELDPKEGYYELEKLMEGKEPSCGYSVLAQVLANTQHNIVISTNFDSLMEDAMFIYTNKRPLVCGHESLTGFIKPIQTRPLIAKIHRDVLLGPKSSVQETELLETNWEKALSNIFKLYTPIVIGYGGNDGSLMGFLGKVDAIEGGIFWCYWAPGGLPDERIQNLVAKHSGYLIPVEGFDEMMVQLSSTLGYELLDKKIITIAGNRADNYRKQIEKIQKSKLSDETSKALDKTIKDSEQDWWIVGLKASKTKNADKKQQIYLEGLKKYPKSHELMAGYADFLSDVRKDHDSAEKYYKKALELSPDDSWVVGSYADFLSGVRKDHDNAEKYYKKALELSPDDGGAAGSYADFLSDVRKDRDNAEKYYKKALELSPDDGRAAGSYANFLYYVRKDYDNAEKYYKKALELSPDNGWVAGNYANFLSDVRKDHDNAEKYCKKAVELSPDDGGVAGSYANFLSDVRKDYDTAEKYYKKAVELSPDDSWVAGSYANFLYYVRKDYDNAEKYYEKAIKVSPDEGWVVGNYADFLSDVRKDHDNAKKYYKKSLTLLPDDTNGIGNYAKFLIEQKNFKKAEENIDKVFSLKPNNESLLVELWFYRYAIFPDKYKDAYENLIKLVKSGARSIGWNLKGVIKIAEKRGHKNVDTLKKLDAIITEDKPIDILDK